MTIIQALRFAEKYLTEKGIENSKLNSDLLLCHILGYDRVKLYTNFDQPLKEQELKKYGEIVRRRGQHEPLQYILGETEFYNCKIKVNRNVLIPRQETELLVEYIIEKAKDKIVNILDIGCGSGNISIALAKNLNGARITAIDVSQSALELAIKNAELNNVRNIVFKHHDIFHNFELNEEFDFIVSNPPYINQEDEKKIKEEIVNYEPHLALFTSDRIQIYNQICLIAQKYLKNRGELIVEIESTSADEISRIFNNNSFSHLILKDYLNLDRLIIGERLK